MERLLHKFEIARAMLPADVKRAGKPAKIGVIYSGSTSPAMNEAVDILAAKGVAVDALRVRAFPLSKAIADFVDEHEIVFVVEQNRDAQMRSLMTIDLEIDPGATDVHAAIRRPADHRAVHRRQIASGLPPPPPVLEAVS